MSAEQVSNQVVDLAHYRAARVAASRVVIPYLLWHPLTGFRRVQPGGSKAVVAGHRSAGARQPRF